MCGRPYGGEVVYTGPLDELFGLDLGALPYRTLDMEFETLDVDQFQPVGTVNYTTSEDFTRITEFKNMTGQVVPGKTTIMKEYSKAYTPGSGETRTTRSSRTRTSSCTAAIASASTAS